MFESDEKTTSKAAKNDVVENDEKKTSTKKQRKNDYVEYDEKMTWKTTLK